MVFPPVFGRTCQNESNKLLTKEASRATTSTKKQVFKNFVVNHQKKMDSEEWWQIYLGVLGKKGGNEEFVEKEFLQRKTLEEKEELTSLKKGHFLVYCFRKKRVFKILF